MTHVRPFSLTNQAINSEKIQKYDGGILPCDGKGTGNKEGVGKKNPKPWGRKKSSHQSELFLPQLMDSDSGICLSRS